MQLTVRHRVTNHAEVLSFFGGGRLEGEFEGDEVGAFGEFGVAGGDELLHFGVVGEEAKHLADEAVGGFGLDGDFKGAGVEELGGGTLGFGGAGAGEGLGDAPVYRCGAVDGESDGAAGDDGVAQMIVGAGEDGVEALRGEGLIGGVGLCGADGGAIGEGKLGGGSLESGLDLSMDLGLDLGLSLGEGGGDAG